MAEINMGYYLDVRLEVRIKGSDQWDIPPNISHLIRIGEITNPLIQTHHFSPFTSGTELMIPMAKRPSSRSCGCDAMIVFRVSKTANQPGSTDHCSYGHRPSTWKTEQSDLLIGKRLFF